MKAKIIICVALSTLLAGCSNGRQAVESHLPNAPYGAEKSLSVDALISCGMSGNMMINGQVYSISPSLCAAEVQKHVDAGEITMAQVNAKASQFQANTNPQDTVNKGVATYGSSNSTTTMDAEVQKEQKYKHRMRILSRLQTMSECNDYPRLCELHQMNHDLDREAAEDDDYY